MDDDGDDQSESEVNEDVTGGFTGVQGVRSNPPLEPNYFLFMGNSKTF